MKIITAMAALLLFTGGAAAQSTNDIWKAMVDRAFAQHWRSHHECYAQNVTPYCSTVLASPTNAQGKYIVLAEFYDIDQNLTGRTLCTYDASFGGVRTCLNIDTLIETKEVLDGETHEWNVVSRSHVDPPPTPQATETMPLPQVSPVPTVPLPQAPFLSLVREWDELQRSNTTIRRSLYLKPDGTMHLVAVEHDAQGTWIGGSTCEFNQDGSMNECINNNGGHYKLQPRSITWFYSMKR